MTLRHPVRLMRFHWKAAAAAFLLIALLTYPVDLLLVKKLLATPAPEPAVKSATEQPPATTPPPTAIPIKPAVVADVTPTAPVSGETEEARRERQRKDIQRATAQVVQLQAAQDDLEAKRDALDHTGDHQYAEWQDDLRLSHAPRKPAPESPAEIATRRQLTAARDNLATMRERFTEQHPDVVAARTSVAELEQELNREIAARLAAPDPADEAQARYAAAATRLQGEYATTKEQLAELDQAMDANGDQLGRAQQFLRFARQAAAAPQPQSSSNTPAAQPPAPIPAAAAVPQSPIPASNKPNNAVPAPSSAPPPPRDTQYDPLFAIALSLLWGTLAIPLALLLAESSDKSVKDEAQVKAALPSEIVFLGTIPHMPATPIQRARTAPARAR